MLTCLPICFPLHVVHLVTPNCDIPSDVPNINPKTIVKPNILIGTPIHSIANATHVPRDLTALCLDTPNPWASLPHHRSQKPHHPVRQNQHLFKYPANICIHSPLKLKPSPLLGIFETIRHPHGIRPTKPVIRVPAQMAMDTPANLAPPMHHAIVKSAPPSLPLHSAIAVQCQCGQLICISNALQIRNIPLHHTLHTFISNFF